MAINFDMSLEEQLIVDKILERGASILDIDKSRLMDHWMDIAACHLNGCPLDLQAFLEGEKSDFVHDFAGITWNIDRRTGQLENCFLPRFAKR